MATQTVDRFTFYAFSLMLAAFAAYLWLLFFAGHLVFLWKDAHAPLSTWQIMIIEAHRVFGQTWLPLAMVGAFATVLVLRTCTTKNFRRSAN